MRSHPDAVPGKNRRVVQQTDHPVGTHAVEFCFRKRLAQRSEQSVGHREVPGDILLPHLYRIWLFEVVLHVKSRNHQTACV